MGRIPSDPNRGRRLIRRFSPANLSALQQVARVVNRNLHEYVKIHKLGDQWAIVEEVAVCVIAGPQAHDLIAPRERLASLLDAGLYVVHVENARDEPEEKLRTLTTNLAFARNLEPG